MNTAVQVCEPGLQLCLVLAPRHTVDARGGVSLEREKRLPQAVGVDVVKQRGEPFLLPLLRGLP